ncbi:MAG: hypothetical protein ACJ75B_18730 [Flavisolibacter sp.]
MKNLFIFFLLCLSCPLLILAQTNHSNNRIDRQSLVRRHNVVITQADSLSSLSIGNGKFAFTVDVTGLQSFPLDYQNGIPLGTESEWGWHRFADTNHYERSEALRTYHLNGRDISYMVQWNEPPRKRNASNWFRQNPHRLQLGNLGLELRKKDGSPAVLSDIQNIHQELDLWTGTITSHFTLEGIPVTVLSCCHHLDDAIGIKIKSPLIREGRLKIRLVFPYPTGEWADAGTNWNKDEQHQSLIAQKFSQGAEVLHRLDSTEYGVRLWWKGQANLSKKKEHYFLLSPSSALEDFECTAVFYPAKKFREILSYEQIRKGSQSAWKSFWTQGAAVDFKGSTDPRAWELERRIVLSQYLLKLQESGSYPPQETGLTYNSWFGKPHLEMHWWHAAHDALWGRTSLLEKSLDWYATVASKARAIAQRQGFDGVRWQKMTDNEGEESPSSVGAFLIWQQPHFIYFAELCYRNKKDAATLQKYKDLVFATADFMASFPYFDSLKRKFILGRGLIPAQERFKPEKSFNPTFELVYWHWALSVAQQWRQRLHLPKNKKWEKLLRNLSPLPVKDQRYLFTESATDSYTNPEFRTDHPAVLGAFGMLPETGQVDTAIMKNTFDWIWQNWSWKQTWGWDFPLTAMCATRLHQPEKAIEALFMPVPTNTYLVNGHNYQDGRLRLYLPGNGGLLTAIALMCAGYDGCSIANPGIPKNGKWKVKWEGLKRLP